MVPNCNSRASDQPTKADTSKTRHDSTSARRTSSLASVSTSTGGSHSAQSKGQSGDYAMKSWLQQSPQSDPWTAVARLGGQRLHVANGDKHNEKQGTSGPSLKMEIELTALPGRKAKTV